MGDTFDRWLLKMADSALKSTPVPIFPAIICGQFGDRLIRLANSGLVENYPGNYLGKQSGTAE